MKITDIPSAKKAMEELHRMGAKTVVLSSLDFEVLSEKLIGLASTVKGLQDDLFTLNVGVF